MQCGNEDMGHLLVLHYKNTPLHTDVYIVIQQYSIKYSLASFDYLPDCFTCISIWNKVTHVQTSLRNVAVLPPHMLNKSIIKSILNTLYSWQEFKKPCRT